jgi:uncharacterized protein
MNLRGRFLDIELDHDGAVVLDFNRPYNPTCAFTPFVSCPLPPRQNRLPVRIEAGEEKYATPFFGVPGRLYGNDRSQSR